MEYLLDLAAGLARRAGLLLREHFGREQLVGHKSGDELVTKMDRKSEALILEAIAREFPDHALLSEEGGELGEASPWRWIVDPLDGSNNYAHGYPCFAVSIALEKEGEVVLGAVYNPILDELLTALAGGGAFINGKPTRVSGTNSLKESLLATGFPYDKRASAEDNLVPFCRFTKRARGIRRDGSAALDLCHVAMGRLDGFWEPKLSPWDVAAGSLLVREAGGEVTDFKGGPFSIYEGQVLASNGIIHADMLDVLALGGKLDGLSL